MKCTCLIITLFLAFGVSSCRKDNSGLVPGVGKTNSSSYLPLTKNSKRVYSVTTGNSKMRYEETITGVTKTFNGKAYFEATQVTQGQADVSMVYYFEGNNSYIIRMPHTDVSLDVEYLNDKEPEGYSWTKSVTPNGTVHSFPARIIGVIKAKNVQKKVLGKIYEDVIHSTVELQYNYSSGYETAATYQFYAAKGIGIILIETHINTLGVELTTKGELVSYKIM